MKKSLSSTLTSTWRSARSVLVSVWRSTAGLALVALIAAAIILGIWIGRGPIRTAERDAQTEAAAHEHEHGGAHAHGGDEPVREYTCSMHPQVRLQDPNAKCPICFMDLIPVGEADAVGEREIVMSETALRLAEIQTASVVRRFPAGEVRMVGRVDFDETRTAAISAWFPGRIERLHVDFTGTTVRRGQPLAEIYSPELLAAQEELRQASRALGSVRNGSVMVRETTEGTVAAARDKLRLLGLTEEQIRSIETADAPLERLTIHSPIDGVVVRREALVGRYVATADEIYSIADLSHVWVRLEAFESQLPWLRYGQEVTFTSDAFPGETFSGRIAFIDPVLAPATRTVRVRISAPNPDGRLKPGMFVRSTVRARLGGDGQVVSDELAGRWISPVHPEIIRDEPGEHDGVPLVPAEELGYITDLAGIDPPLVIPSTAPLITGRRAVVYVRQSDTEKPTFEGREVVLGPRAGNWYIVKEGLREGEQVVVNGAFKIDSAMQLAAKPSMIDPGGGGATPGHHGMEARGTDRHQQDVPEEFLFSLKPVFGAHLDAQKALADDDLARFHIATGDLLAALDGVRTRGLVGEPLGLWRRADSRLRARADHIRHIEDIEEARTLFEGHAMAMLEVADRFGHLGTVPYYRAHCPMAFDDRGADWLQMGEEIANPYFGASMLRCGDIRGRFDPRGQREIGGRQ